HTALWTEACDGVSLVLSIDQEHILLAVHRRPPFFVSLTSFRGRSCGLKRIQLCALICNCHRAHPIIVPVYSISLDSFEVTLRLCNLESAIVLLQFLITDPLDLLLFLLGQLLPDGLIHLD